MAQVYLSAAVLELASPTGGGGPFDAAGVDPELWEFVGADVEGEHWGKAATQMTFLLEDRIRTWTGQPPESVGEKLMSAVIGQGDNDRLGLTDGEKDGWNLFAMGISKASRNAAAHRIDTRPDHRRYVLGVLGSCSLLLTQLRLEHGNRFQDRHRQPLERRPASSRARTPPRAAVNALAPWSPDAPHRHRGRGGRAPGR